MKIYKYYFPKNPSEVYPVRKNLKTGRLYSYLFDTDASWKLIYRGREPWLEKRYFPVLIKTFFKLCKQQQLKEKLERV